VTDKGFGRVLVGDKVAISKPTRHDSFAFRIYGGYQARCMCGVKGGFHDGLNEKARKQAVADAAKHNKEH
jgi:hypothetical protein